MFFLKLKIGSDENDPISTADYNYGFIVTNETGLSEKSSTVIVMLLRAYFLISMIEGAQASVRK